MKDNYFCGDVYYLTKDGFKQASELTDRDNLYYVDANGYLKMTNNFRVSSTTSCSYYRHKKNPFCIFDSLKEKETSIRPSVYNDFAIPLDTDSIRYTFEINNKKYKKDFETCMALSFFISNYFYFDGVKYNQLNKVDNKTMYFITKDIFNYEGLFITFDKDKKQYYLDNTSLYKSSDRYHELLLENFNSFRKILEKLKKYNLIFGNYTGIFYVNNYRIARLFQALLHLSDYISYLEFDKTKKYFKIIYIKSSKLKKYKANDKLIEVEEPITFYKVSSDIKGRFIISQNINRKTTVSLVEISNEDFI